MLSSPRRPTSPLRRFLTISFIVAFTYYFFIEEIPDDQETFAADGAGEIPKDSYPGKEDGFIRGENPKGEEVYRYEQNGQVYVIPAEQYYNWRNEYYYDGYHGGLTHVMLQALLFSHLYRVMTFPHAGFVSSYGWHSPTTVYYHSPAYTAHYGAPSFVNGRVVHSTAGAGGTPVVRGTPVAQARPVAVGRPVGGTTAAASSTPIAKGTPVATGKPVAATAAAKPSGGFFGGLFGGRSSSTPTASTPTARPTYTRPTYRRPPTRYTTRFRSAARFACFIDTAQVTLMSGLTVPISSLKPGDYVAGWPNKAAVLRNEKAQAIKVRKVEVVEDSYPPLRGFDIVMPDGDRHVRPPFVTTSHALLTVDRGWSALDASLATAELADYRPHNMSGWVEDTGGPYRPPTINPLSIGDEVVFAPWGAPIVRSATLDHVYHEMSEVTEKYRQDEYYGEVYSLELDVNDFGVYIVNGMLAMD